MMPRPALACALLAVAGCTAQTPEPTGSALPEVASFGAMHEIVHGDDLAARVMLDSLGHDPGRVGLGALSDLRGEITILDGDVWLAYPDGETDTRTEIAATSNEGAALFVTAVVPRWQRIELTRDIAWDELEAVVESLGVQAGLPASGPFPFVIEGRMNHLAWHVIDGNRIDPLEVAARGHAAHSEAAVQQEVDDRDATLVGFFSHEHAGVFTHMGSAMHVHACMSGPDRTGHVERADIAAGATVRLPGVR